MIPISKDSKKIEPKRGHTRKLNKQEEPEDLGDVTLPQIEPDMVEIHNVVDSITNPELENSEGASPETIQEKRELPARNELTLKIITYFYGERLKYFLEKGYF